MKKKMVWLAFIPRAKIADITSHKILCLTGYVSIMIISKNNK